MLRAEADVVVRPDALVFMSRGTAVSPESAGFNGKDDESTIANLMLADAAAGQGAARVVRLLDDLDIERSGGAPLLAIGVRDV